LAIARGLGYPCAFGPDIAPDANRPMRDSYAEVVLPGNLREALATIRRGTRTSERTGTGGFLLYQSQQPALQPTSFLPSPHPRPSPPVMDSRPHRWYIAPTTQ